MIMIDIFSFFKKIIVYLSERESVCAHAHTGGGAEGENLEADS